MSSRNCFADIFNFIFFLILGKLAADDVKLGAMELKPNFKLMMVGSLEVDIEGVQNYLSDDLDVVNDLDNEEEEIAIENTEVKI